MAQYYRPDTAVRGSAPQYDINAMLRSGDTIAKALASVGERERADYAVQQEAERQNKLLTMKERQHQENLAFKKGAIDKEEERARQMAKGVIDANKFVYGDREVTNQADIDAANKYNADIEANRKAYSNAVPDTFGGADRRRIEAIVSQLSKFKTDDEGKYVNPTAAAALEAELAKYSDRYRNAVEDRAKGVTGLSVDPYTLELAPVRPLEVSTERGILDRATAADKMRAYLAENPNANPYYLQGLMQGVNTTYTEDAEKLDRQAEKTFVNALAEKYNLPVGADADTTLKAIKVNNDYADKATSYSDAGLELAKMGVDDDDIPKILSEARNRNVKPKDLINYINVAKERDWVWGMRFSGYTADDIINQMQNK